MEYTWNGLAGLWPRVFDLGVNLLVALLILGAGWWISNLLGRWVRRMAARSPHIDPTVVPMFASVVTWAVRVFTIIAVLARFGVQTASLIAVLGAAGLAIGLALQGTLQNISAGIMLLILRPIRAGEYVALSTGIDGTVDEVGLFLTRLIKADGITVTLPNSTVWNATITNYARNATRRLDVPVVIQYGDDVDAAIERLQQLVAGHPDVLETPAPVVKIEDYRDNGVLVNVRVWTPSSKFGDLRWEMLHSVRKTLDDAGFQSPLPLQRAIHVGAAGHDEGAENAGAAQAARATENRANPANLANPAHPSNPSHPGSSA
ncbi:mechanosensitive ion channel family protein [Bordetella genomosp. 13]|uniref:Small-conductance mechanosensitive channel n=1 Tax=Bordetella genomosp. 13 TaxID=463040 RepID=A0A1W6ZC88_9BORD|nr:mechanosensitive ion channel domain-containing protein [Bordetella genomosp. 13]ARP95006.1 mechanosensitive ion channel protein MscS [Bordetella genomosp. 13]